MEEGAGEERGARRSHVGRHDGDVVEDAGVGVGGVRGRAGEHLGVVGFAVAVGIAPQHHLVGGSAEDVAEHHRDGADGLAARLDLELVEPDVVGHAEHAVVALAAAVVEGVLDLERRRAELALVGNEIAVAVEAHPGEDVDRIEGAVAVAVLALVGHAGAVEVLADSRGDVALVEQAVLIAVVPLEFAGIGHAVLVAVAEEDLALVGDEIAVAVEAHPRSDVARVEDAVAVAVLALVGNAGAVAVGAGAVVDVALVGDAVLVAVAAGGGRHRPDQPLAGEERLLDGLEGDRAGGEVVRIDRRVVSDQPAALDEDLAVGVERRREVRLGHRHPRPHEERGAGRSHRDVLDVEGAEDRERRGVDHLRAQQLRIVGDAVAVGIAPDPDGGGGVLGQEDEHELQRLDHAGAVIDAEAGEPGHPGAFRADAELRGTVVDGVDERFAELALVGHAVAVAVSAGARREVAGVDDAVAVAVLEVELALVGEAVAVAVDRGIGGDLAGIEDAVAVAVALVAVEDLADVADSVTVAVGVAEVGVAVEVAVVEQAVGDVAGVGHAVVVAVEAARIVEHPLGIEDPAGDSQFVEVAAEELVEGSVGAGVGTHEQRATALDPREVADRHRLEHAVDREAHGVGDRIEGDGDEVPVAAGDLDRGDRRPRAGGSAAAVAEADGHLASRDRTGVAEDGVDGAGKVADLRIEGVLELPVACIRGLALHEQPTLGRAAGPAEAGETDPCLDGEALLSEGQPRLGVGHHHASGSAEVPRQQVRCSGLRNRRDRHLGEGGGRGRDRVESPRPRVGEDRTLLEAPVPRRNRRNHIAEVGDAVAVAIGMTLEERLGIDHAVEVAVLRRIRPSVAVEVCKRLQRRGWNHLAFAAGSPPLESSEGAAARFVVVHADRDRIAVEIDAGRPRGGALRLPLVDDAHPIDPEPHSVVGGGPEGVGPGDRCSQQAGPAHAELVDGHGRVAVEVEVDLRIDAAEESLREVAGAADRLPVLPAEPFTRGELAGIEKPVAVWIEAALALVGKSVAVAVEARAVSDVLRVGHSVAVAVLRIAKPIRERRAAAGEERQ